GQGQKREHGITIIQQAMRCEVKDFVFRRFSFCHFFARLRSNEDTTLTSPIKSRKSLDLLFSFRQRTESFKVRSSNRAARLTTQLWITKCQQRPATCWRTRLPGYFSQHAQ